MKVTNKFILSAGIIVAAAVATATAGEVQPPEMKETKPSLSEPWEFLIKPYGWTLGIDGDIGVKGITAPVDVSFSDLLPHLDWAAMLALEVRKGRWGVMADGLFAQLSDVADASGQLYYNSNFKIQEGLAEAALAYRMVDNKYGFLDVFAGARYTYLELDVTASINSGGIQNVSENASERVAHGLGRAADAIIANGGLPPDEIRRRLRKDAADRVETAWKDLPDGIRRFLTRPGAGGVLRAVSDETAALAKATADSRLAAAGSAERAAAEKRAQQAEKDLANALSKEIKKRLPTSASGNQQWVDPFVGLRGQLNLTERLFLAARGDIGGFGVGSHLALQALVTVGYNFSKNIFVEAGYRYIKTDYTNGGFTWDVAQGGAFLGLGIKF